MAIDPSTKYSGQVDSDAGYPYGKAKNRSAPAATDGTPLERDWLNDLWGLLQKILDYGSVTPSGTPDSITTSQYWNTLYAMARTIADSETLTVDANGLLDVDYYGLLRILDGGGFRILSGGQGYIESGGDLTTLSGGTVTKASGSTTTYQDGSALSFEDVTNISTGIYTRTFFIGPLTRSEAYNFNVISYYGSGLFWKQGTTPGSTDHFNVGLEGIPRRGALKAIDVWCRGATGHSVMPEYPPEVKLGSIDPGVSGAITNIDTKTDSGSVSEYESTHVIHMAPLSQSLYNYNRYIISVRGESGNNSLGGLEIYGISVQADFTALELC